MKQILKLISNFLPSGGNDLKSKAIKNTYWLFFDQFVRMGIGFFLLAILARQFGPEAFGKLNYAIAFVSLFSVLATLGIERIIVREIINYPNDNKLTLNAGFLLKFFGGISLVLTATSFSYFFDTVDKKLTMLVFIFSMTTVFQATDVIEYWFQANLNSKYSVIAKFLAFLISTVFKLFVAFTNKSIIQLATVYLIEAILASILLFFIFIYQHNVITFEINKSKIKSLLKQGIPLIFSSLFVTIYMKIDQVFLQHLTNSTTVGIYSAAVRISEIPFFLGTIITNAAFPVILQSKIISLSKYNNDLQLLFNILSFLAICICIVTFIFAETFIKSVFGSEYTAAANVLKIHIWSLLFVFLGLAQGLWIISEGLNHFSLLFTMIGAIMNVILNIILIPYYGAEGAAIATVFSYMTSGFLINFLIKRTMNIGKMQLSSLFPVRLLLKLKNND